MRDARAALEVSNVVEAPETIAILRQAIDDQ